MIKVRMGYWYQWFMFRNIRIRRLAQNQINRKTLYSQIHGRRLAQFFGYKIEKIMDKI